MAIDPAPASAGQELQGADGRHGVDLLVNLTPEERLASVERVRGNPEGYIVQELLPSGVMVAPAGSVTANSVTGGNPTIVS